MQHITIIFILLILSKSFALVQGVDDSLETKSASITNASRVTNPTDSIMILRNGNTSITSPESLSVKQAAYADNAGHATTADSAGINGPHGVDSAYLPYSRGDNQWGTTGIAYDSATGDATFPRYLLSPNNSIPFIIAKNSSNERIIMGFSGSDKGIYRDSGSYAVFYGENYGLNKSGDIDLLSGEEGTINLFAAFGDVNVMGQNSVKISFGDTLVDYLRFTPATAKDGVQALVPDYFKLTTGVRGGLYIDTGITTIDTLFCDKINGVYQIKSRAHYGNLKSFLSGDTASAVVSDSVLLNSKDTIVANIRIIEVTGKGFFYGTDTIVIQSKFKNYSHQIFDTALTVIFDTGTIETINPAMFGHLPESDKKVNSKALNNAAVAAQNIGSITVGPGTYLHDSTVFFNKSVVLKGAGREKTVFDFSQGTGFAVNYCMRFFENDFELIADGIEGDIPKGAIAVDVISSHGLDTGDIICIHDNRTSSWSTSNAIYKKGEFCRVRYVDSDSIYLLSPTYDDYTDQDSLLLYKVNNSSYELSDFTIIADSVTAQVGAYIVNGIDVKIDNVASYGTPITNLYLFRCLSTVATNCIMLNDFPSVNQNYGFGIVNCQDVKISNCDLYTTRHPILIGGSTGYGTIVNRDVNIFSNTLRNANDALTWCADMHGCSEHITYNNNIIIGGALIGGNHAKYIGNDIYAKGLDGVAFYSSDQQGLDYVIDDNDIYCTKDLSSDQGIFTLSGDFYASDSGTEIITNNRIHRYGYTGAVLRMDKKSTPTKSFVFDNNKMDYSGTVADSGLIVKVSTGTFDFISVSNNKLYGSGITLNGTSPHKMEVKNNEIRYPYYGIYLGPRLTGGHPGNFTLSGNSISGSWMTGIYAWFTTTYNNNASISKNHIVNSCQNPSGTGNEFTDCHIWTKWGNKLDLSGNILSDTSMAAPKIKYNYVIDTTTICNDNMNSIFGNCRTYWMWSQLLSDKYYHRNEQYSFMARDTADSSYKILVDPFKISIYKQAAVIPITQYIGATIHSHDDTIPQVMSTSYKIDSVFMYTENVKNVPMANADTVGDRIILPFNGYWTLLLNRSEYSSVGNVDAKSAAFLNENELDHIHIEVKFPTANYFQLMPLSGVFKVTDAPDTLTVRTKVATGSPTMNNVYSSLTVKYSGTD